MGAAPVLPGPAARREGRWPRAAAGQDDNKRAFSVGQAAGRPRCGRRKGRRMTTALFCAAGALALSGLVKKECRRWERRLCAGKDR